MGNVKHSPMCRPVPEWYVMVDSWLNIPYPDWYLEYVRLHFRAALFPEPFMATFANAAKSGNEQLEKVSLTPSYITNCTLPRCALNGCFSGCTHPRSYQCTCTDSL